MMNSKIKNFRSIACLLLMTVFVLNVNAQKKTKEPKVYTIVISKMKFTPPSLVVEKGSKVIWINKEFYPHDVTDEVKKAWSSKPLNQNQSWSKIITKNENYFCNLHKTMKGNIIVK